MGGFGSTRWGWNSAKNTVEGNRRLDINQFNRAGCLRPGYCGGWEWTRDGEQVASIRFRRDGDRLLLSYRVRQHGGANLSLDAQQLGPADGFVDDSERIALAALCCGERFDRVIEQKHQAADIPRPGDITPFAGLPGAREQAADQLVRHIEHRVGKTGFEIDDRGDKDRASSVRRVAADLMRIGYAALADQLLQAVVVDAPGSLGRNANFTHAAEPIEQRPHMVRLGCGRSIPQPGERRRVERRVGEEQCVEFGELPRREAREERIRRPLACPGPPRDGVRSMTAGTGRMIFAVRSATIMPATIGEPRSVLQADCAAASIMKGKSALLGGRKPSVVASTSAWSVIVCGRPA
jgi:hypothetical protein